MSLISQSLRRLSESHPQLGGDYREAGPMVLEFPAAALEAAEQVAWDPPTVDFELVAPESYEAYEADEGDPDGEPIAPALAADWSGSTYDAWQVPELLVTAFPDLEPPHTSEHDVSTVSADIPAETPLAALEETSTSSIESPPEPPPPPSRAPAAAVALAAAILQDLGAVAGSKRGKVVALVGVQADRDVAAACAAIVDALASLEEGDVLLLDAHAASPPPTDEWPSCQSQSECRSAGADGRAAADEESVAAAHGFTSLLDGTRAVEDVLAATDSPRIFRISRGLEKGDQQVADPSALDRALATCRERFACTVICGGSWQNEHLAAIGPSADAVYLVVRANVTERETATQAMQHFDRCGVRVRGCILAGSVASGGLLT